MSNHPERLFLPAEGPQIARPFAKGECTEYRRHDPAMVRELAENLCMAVDFDFPDFYIGPANDPQLERWHIRRNKDLGHVYLHVIHKDDDDRDLHDHPWDSTSIVLKGVLREVTFEGSQTIYPGQIVSRKADTAHRLEVASEEPVVSLFITAPKTREWGFHTEDGWVHHEEYSDFLRRKKEL